MIQLMQKYYLFFKWSITRIKLLRTKNKQYFYENHSTIYSKELLNYLETDNSSMVEIKKYKQETGAKKDFEAMLTRMCFLFNEEMLSALPQFEETEIYKKMEAKMDSIYKLQNSKIEIFELITLLFEMPINILKIMCPTLNDFEIYLLILIKSGLPISKIYLHLEIYDPSILYQRKYRMKKKIYSQDYGKRIYKLLLDNK